MGGCRLAIIIPAYNEVRTIGAVVAAARRFGRVVVVDDASTDGTSEAAAAAGADVVRQPVNGGYDAALNAGFAAAARAEAAIVVTMDADGQHSASSIARVAGPLLGDRIDVVIGTRPAPSRAAEALFQVLAALRFGIRDPLSGMKAYRMTVYSELRHFDSYKSIGTELALFAARRGRRILHVRIPISPRLDEPRFGRSLRANLRILRAMTLGLLPRPRPRPAAAPRSSFK